jgi:uncharacterized protein YebE (UPF0316 family)
MFSCLFYFFCGVVLDILITLHVRAISENHRFAAAFLSCLISAAGILSVELIISRSWTDLFGYIVGTGFGCFLGMTLKKKPSNQ